MISEKAPKGILNPNRLEGHEGYMLKLLTEVEGYLGCPKNVDSVFSADLSSRKSIPGNSIVMIVSAWNNHNRDRS